MTTLVLGGLAVVAGVALLGVVGALLPRHHRAARRLRLAKTPAAVWEVIRDIGAVPTWWPEIKRVERLADHVGQERFRQFLGHGFSMTTVIAESVAPERLRTVIEAPPGAAFGGAWIYELTPDGTGTMLRLTEEGWIRNPYFRLATRVMGYQRTLDGYLVALARHFGETARPEQAP